MDGAIDKLTNTYLGLIPILGVLWVLDIPQSYLGIAIVGEEAVTTILGVACAAAFLKYLPHEKPRCFRCNHRDVNVRRRRNLPEMNAEAVRKH